MDESVKKLKCRVISCRGMICECVLVKIWCPCPRFSLKYDLWMIECHNLFNFFSKPQLKCNEVRLNGSWMISRYGLTFEAFVNKRKNEKKKSFSWKPNFVNGSRNKIIAQKKLNKSDIFFSFLCVDSVAVVVVFISLELEFFVCTTYGVV